MATSTPVTTGTLTVTTPGTAQNITAHHLRPAAVHLTGVSRAFGNGPSRNEVLRDIDLHVEPGEVVVLLGPSGCGKSTLLRLAAGLDQPTSGTVEVDGHLVRGVDERCAVVFQEPRLLPWRSIVSNVRLGLRRRKDDGAALAWLDTVGLSGFADHLPREVSGGMAQRAALARALVGEPGVLLLDEPFAALDALTRLQMQDLLVDVVDRTGATVIMVTHDIDEALYVADRIIVLGERGQGITATLSVEHPRPRDRSDETLVPLRTTLLGHFGVHR
jgi:sulfonate transport system ATP-binding protein